MKHIIIELADSSELDVFYEYDAGERQTWEHPGSPPTWEITRLFHTKKIYPDSLVMVNPAICVTNLMHLIDAIMEDKLFQELYAKIEEAIGEEEAEPPDELLEAAPDREV